MFLERLFQKSGVQLMKKNLDAAALKQRTIASNIANINTPGYQRKDVIFSEQLQKSINSQKTSTKITNPRHIPISGSNIDRIQPEIVTDSSTELSIGVNNVDIDQEMAELATNQMNFSATATLIARRFRGLKAAIKGRV